MPNTDVEALKKLYTKLGGDDDVTAINTSSEMIDKLADVVESSGGGSSSGGGGTVIPLDTYNYGGARPYWTLSDGWTYESIREMVLNNNLDILIRVPSSSQPNNFYVLRFDEIKSAQIVFIHFYPGNTFMMGTLESDDRLYMTTNRT